MTTAQYAEAYSLGYRWWTVKAWRSVGHGAVKVGPVTALWYRWFDDRMRVSWTFLCGHEHIVIGGPLS